MKIKNTSVQNVIRKVKHRRTLFLERHLQNYIFIHINKTGGTSIERALGGKFQHKTAREKIAELGEAVWQAKFTFAFVRNPWDKMVSQYPLSRPHQQGRPGRQSDRFSRLDPGGPGRSSPWLLRRAEDVHAAAGLDHG